MFDRECVSLTLLDARLKGKRSVFRGSLDIENQKEGLVNKTTRTMAQWSPPCPLLPPTSPLDLLPEERGFHGERDLLTEGWQAEGGTLIRNDGSTKPR